MKKLSPIFWITISLVIFLWLTLGFVFILATVPGVMDSTDKILNNTLPGLGANIISFAPAWYLLTGFIVIALLINIIPNHPNLIMKPIRRLFQTEARPVDKQKLTSIMELRGNLPPIINPVDYKNTENLDFEWEVNYPWYLKRIEGKEVLDAGFMAHLAFAKSLTAYGFTVYGVDLQPMKSPGNILAIQKSILDTGLKDNWCDTVIFNSLLEHLGMDHYKGAETMNVLTAQNRAVAEAHRLLKKDGVLLLQVPYGSTNTIISIKNKPFYEVVTGTRLKSLLTDFRTEELTYFIKERSGWLEVNQTVADKVYVGGSYPPCLALVKARKVN